MPIYEYQCDECKKIEEVLELHPEESHNGLFCPHCELGTMKKIMSASAIIELSHLRIPSKRSRKRTKSIF
jgi:putative FmdB family regulatory protein